MKSGDDDEPGIENYKEFFKPFKFICNEVFLAVGVVKLTNYFQLSLVPSSKLTALALSTTSFVILLFLIMAWTLAGSGDQVKNSGVALQAIKYLTRARKIKIQ